MLAFPNFKTFQRKMAQLVAPEIFLNGLGADRKVSELMESAFLS